LACAVQCRQKLDVKVESATSVGAGLFVARHTTLDEPTAALGLIAGGSSGIVAAADDLDADARIVAVLQYVRLILVGLPVVGASGVAVPNSATFSNEPVMRGTVSCRRVGYRCVAWPIR